jgi:putative transposase
MAGQRLAEFEAGEWGRKYPDHRRELAARMGASHPLFRLSAEVRKIIYTTNAIESLNMQLRKVHQERADTSPRDEAATKLMYLALRNIAAKWTHPPHAWKAAANQFAIQFGPRFFSSSAC